MDGSLLQLNSCGKYILMLKLSLILKMFLVMELCKLGGLEELLIRKRHFNEQVGGGFRTLYLPS